MLRIVFMGTPDFATVSLDRLNKSENEILAVISQPDRPKGRGMKLIPSSVKQYALENNLKVYTPEKIKLDTQIIDMLKNLNPDIIVVVAYGQILSKDILDIPKYGCINVHASLLPKYRGAAPIQWSIINGDKTTGVSIMQMDEGMDTGAVIQKQETPIGEDETTGELFERLSHIGADLLIDTLTLIEKHQTNTIPQGNHFTMAPMITKEMSQIDWEFLNSLEIKNLVRGLNPIMGAKAILNNNIYKFWKVSIVDNNKIDELTNEELNKIPNGQIIHQSDKEGLFIKTKDGIISVLEIQGQNSKKMPIKDFLRGNKI